MDIGDRAERSLEVFFAWLPNLVGALLILVVGWIIARFVAGLVRKGLRGAGLDQRLHESHGGEWVRRVVSSPSNLVGTVAFWAVFLGAIWSWSRIMNVAIAMTKIGPAVETIRPSAVSPMRREASVATPAATALATRKISTAARTFGR